MYPYVHETDCHVVMLLVPIIMFPVVQIDGTVELLARCVRHCSKELQQMRDEDDGGNGSTGPSVQASLQHFQLVLLSTLCNVLALFCPPNRPLGKIIQDAISPLLLDPFLNIAHPNVIAGLLTYARQDVVKIWRDMRHCAHSVAAARALTGMTVDELKVTLVTSLTTCTCRLDDHCPYLYHWQFCVCICVYVYV
eukprot:scpid86221/ scgid2720/ 